MLCVYYLKKYVCIPCKFLIINFWYQGKTLCSLCIIFLLFCMGVKLGLSDWENNSLRVIENIELRKMFGPVAGECTRLRKEQLYNLTKWFPGDQIKKNKMDGACSTYRWEKRGIRWFWWENLRETENLKHTGVAGRIILK